MEEIKVLKPRCWLKRMWIWVLDLRIRVENGGAGEVEDMVEREG